MTRPSPLAPPVITITLPSRERDANVGLENCPPCPTTGLLDGSSWCGGYSTWTSGSVREKERVLSGIGSGGGTIVYQLINSRVELRMELSTILLEAEGAETALYLSPPTSHPPAKACNFSSPDACLSTCYDVFQRHDSGLFQTPTPH